MPGLRPRRQGMLIALAAVICFGVLTALAVRSGGIGSHAKPIAKQPVAATSIPEPQAQQAAAPTDLAVHTAPAPTPSAPAEVDSALAPTALAPTTPAPLEPEAPAVAPTVASEVLPAPAAVKMMRVRISTSPKNAQLLVDGTKTTNPFDARLPAGSVHQVHAQAPGHVDQDITLTLDRERTLALRLNKIPAPAPTPVASKPRPPIATVRPRTPRPVVAPTASTARRTTGAGFVSDSPY